MAKSDTSEAPSLSQKTRALLAKGVEGVRAALVTHHHKIPFTSVNATLGLLDTWAIDRAGSNSLVPGITSAAIHSDSPLGLSFAGQDIAIAQDLCCEIRLPGHAHPVSLLELARRGDADSLASFGLTPEEIAALISAVTDVRSQAPGSVDSGMKQVYFEAGADAVLVTPVYPIKFAAELNSRLRQRDADRKKTDKEASGRKLRIRRIMQPVGGANPQNVGYLVAKTSDSTVRGTIPLLAFTPPADRAGENTRLLRKIIALGAYGKAIPLDTESLALYGRRAALANNLAIHRDAEADHAADIAQEFLTPLSALRPIIAALDTGVWKDPAWSRIDPAERRLLDPRLGILDARLAARACAARVRDRIARQMNRARVEAGQKFSLPARSFAALEDAFISEIAALPSQRGA